MDDDIIDMSKFELLKQTCSSIWTSIWNIIVRFGRVFWIGVGVSFIISLTMGILIGHYGVSNECTEAPEVTDDVSTTTTTSTISPPTQVDIFELFDTTMTGPSVRAHLAILAKDPHTGGTDEDEITLVNFVDAEMKKAHLTVKISEYEVLLSYPQREEGMRNYVAVTDFFGEIIIKSAEVEEILSESQDNPLVFNPFIAYSTAGNISGDIVYVNYARVEDFMHLNETGINVQDQICLSRYGQIFRGNKARYAENYGCKGLILFSDSQDYTQDWIEPYPNSWFLPKTGAQRGSTYLENGDPETPFYPSIPDAYRWTREKTALYGNKFGTTGLPGLPNIPITPIGYGDAKMFIERMQGTPAPSDWQGGIKDDDGAPLVYYYDKMGDGQKAKMYVQNVEMTRITRNVIGYYEGTEEPDRYIIFGNHRDAWVFGAMDPNSGTTIMIEVIKAFGVLYETGWRPRRSLMFASWGSEEYGLIGSQEWVEEHLTLLKANSIVYVNCDVGVSGNWTFSPSGTPNMREIMHEITKLVDNPRINVDGINIKTIYDNMMQKQNKPPGATPNFPGVGSGSDFAPFLQQVGTSIINIGWSPHPSVGGYPVYHSIYETLDLVETFLDPGFHIHRQTALMCGLLLARLCDDSKLPINAIEYAERIEQELDELENKHGEAMMGKDITFNSIRGHAIKFRTAAADLHAALALVQETDTKQLRRLNDKLMMLERSFIDPNGLPDRLQYRHVIFAPSSQNSYASAAFPAVYDALFDIDNADDETKAWENVKEQFATLSFFIYNAATVLSLSII